MPNDMKSCAKAKRMSKKDNTQAWCVIKMDGKFHAVSLTEYDGLAENFAGVRLGAVYQDGLSVSSEDYRK